MYGEKYMRTTQDTKNSEKTAKQALMQLMLGVSDINDIPPDLVIQLTDINTSLDQNLTELRRQVTKFVLWKELTDFLKPYEKNLANGDTQAGLDAIIFLINCNKPEVLQNRIQKCAELFNTTSEMYLYHHNYEELLDWIFRLNEMEIPD